MNFSTFNLVFLLVSNSFNQVHYNRCPAGDLFALINENIDLFNQENEAFDKKETSFSYLRNIIEIKDISRINSIGKILIFDSNEGFLFVSNDYEVLIEEYEHGFPDAYSESETLFFDGLSFFDDNMNVAFVKNHSLYGGDVTEAFHSHYDSTFTSAKTRSLLSEWDPQYATLTDTTNSTYNNKTTWSTYQSEGYNCGPLAIANLLWTYKNNNVVDLTQGYLTSSSLSSALESYCHCSSNNGTTFYDMLGVNDFLTNGYTLDYIDVANGVADNLSISPVIGLYSYNLNDGHFSLITGKGRSVYQKVLWMTFYTSWDIVNTWYSRNNYFGNYPRCKYWVDNQYITFGYCLRDSNNNQVPLNND